MQIPSILVSYNSPCVNVRLLWNITDMVESLRQPVEKEFKAGLKQPLLSLFLQHSAPPTLHLRVHIQTAGVVSLTEQKKMSWLVCWWSLDFYVRTQKGTCRVWEIRLNQLYFCELVAEIWLWKNKKIKLSNYLKRSPY